MGYFIFAPSLNQSPNLIAVIGCIRQRLPNDVPDDEGLFQTPWNPNVICPYKECEKEREKRCALRFYQAGSYATDAYRKHILGRSMDFKTCSATVYNVFHDTVEQLVHNLRMESDAMTDTTILEQRALEFKTSRKRGSPFDGCVGALDFTAIPIEKPRDVPNPASF